MTNKFIKIINEIESKGIRAKKGGEVAMNGEFYKGGAFLPSTKMPKGTPKTKIKALKPKNVEIEPYKWEVVDGDINSVLNLIRMFAFVKDGKATKHQNVSLNYNKFFNGGEKELDDLIKKFNSGYRTFRASSGEFFKV